MIVLFSSSLIDLPPLRFDVVYMDVFASGDRLYDLADIFAILQNRIAYGQVRERNLVTDRNICVGGKPEVRIVLRTNA